MWIIYLVLIILLIGLIFIKSPKGKGMIGEYRINKLLKKAALSYGGYELHDFMFQDNISSSQIDHILLTQKALYVVETKNYQGHIYGNEQSKNWTVTIKHVNKHRGKNGKTYRKTHISKHQFYNPIKQNKTHINKIKNLTNINQDLPIVNIVVFGKKAVLKDLSHSQVNYVVHQNELLKTIHQIELGIKAEVTTEKQIDIIDELFHINIKNRRLRRQHVKRIKKKY